MGSGGQDKDGPKIRDVVEFVDDGLPVPTTESTARGTTIDIRDGLSRLGEPVGDDPAKSYPNSHQLHSSEV
jgi:hypothetical protein